MASFFCAGRSVEIGLSYPADCEGSSLQPVEQKSGPLQQVWQRCAATETVQQLAGVLAPIGPDVPARMSTGSTSITSTAR